MLRLPPANPQGKVRLTRLHAYHCGDSCSYDRTIKYIEKYIELLSTKDTLTTAERVANLHTKIALIYFNEKRKLSFIIKTLPEIIRIPSIKCYKIIQKLYLKCLEYQSEKTSSIFDQIACSYWNNSDYDQACVYLLKTLKIKEE
ncbi:unnamed protein product [Didymodactylos carnosus]|uniref:Uncharacterized protein n=1 Tax=Didymodactylos carnosus TaxID=1234261 RepID=A0A815BX47_9BILA|nr:unnamed protein product [Didymodactylos carnosus]CAF4067951.1 unnamed protein product [Didymodactylos carnosus]